ncbi:uncharacterized protein LAESUDRAFT_738401 [Laetiporus sulphureus 93-53]|uniref:C2H2-type domain-containing protein n=1 Tax=Laetiporus sulphureus 93-53 TaxID=1314785 RepID=A0A165CLJ9_9APHY|nr:uncharacterized protein LAESUDRAFT_738401 [Laetiporus sulphureus 93-53]KZT03027.1 hypothetical protein LAESUDRAFT_738401 [Laetiporus sulphureus 93-53]
MATAQPITFQTTGNDDFTMGSGSFGGHNGSFNPASYTRRLIGSPSLSWRAGSFGNSRFFTGMSPGLLGPLDPNEFKFGKTSSSIESDRGSIVNALSMFDHQQDLCRDYTCCGLNLTDLHALVDHFEECHVVVVDPFAPPMPLQNAQANFPPAQGSYFPEVNGVPTAPTYHHGSFDPDDMELDMDHMSAPSSGASSPPDTPISTPLSSYPSTLYPGSAPASNCSSPMPAPISAFETTTVLPSRSGHSPLSVGFPPASRSSMAGLSPRVDEAFNTYAGYSDYSSLLPGTVPSPTTTTAPPIEGPAGSDARNAYAGRSTCVPPALLLNHSASNTPNSTPSSSRVASPAMGTSVFRNVAAAPPSTSVSGATASGQTARASTTLSRPASSLLLSKPFKCPKPNCNKSYKQANGLKYHMTHGSCNFAPPKDLEQVQALLASKRGGKDDNEPISESELREVEREAERRLRPYACGVGDCQRRYKNMNGLRYHYQHSGDHGAIGLALLASGQHECLQHSKSRHHTPSNSIANAHHNASTTTSAAPSTTSSPLATPPISRPQSTTSQYPSSPLAQPPTYQSVSMHPPQYTSQYSTAPLNPTPVTGASSIQLLSYMTQMSA